MLCGEKGELNVWIARSALVLGMEVLAFDDLHTKRDERRLSRDRLEGVLALGAAACEALVSDP